MSREYTKEEIQEEFLQQCAVMVDYWRNVKFDHPIQDETRYRMTGLLHSVFALLDGCSMMPGFLVIPHPHPDDKEFHIKEGSDWYPESPEGEFCDIAGTLHDRMREFIRD